MIGGNNICWGFISVILSKKLRLLKDFVPVAYILINKM